MEFAKYANYQAFNTIFTSCIDVCISITIHLGFSFEFYFTFIYPFKAQYTKCVLCMQLCAIYEMRIAHAIFFALSKSLYIHVFLLNNTYIHTCMHTYMHACKHSEQTEN